MADCNPLYQKKMRLGVVVHTCNPSYSGGRDQEDHDLRPTSAKKLGGTPSQPIKVECGDTSL
jgi:hypothetical protein